MWLNLKCVHIPGYLQGFFTVTFHSFEGEGRERKREGEKGVDRGRRGERGTAGEE